MHACSWARGSGRGKSSDRHFDYSINRKESIVFSNSNRTILSLCSSHAERQTPKRPTIMLIKMHKAVRMFVHGHAIDTQGTLHSKYKLLDSSFKKYTDGVKTNYPSWNSMQLNTIMTQTAASKNYYKVSPTSVWQSQQKKLCSYYFVHPGIPSTTDEM